MNDCLFCKIINGEIPSSKVYEDDLCFAFNDINPQAPVHVLVVPKVHIESVNEINQQNQDVVAHIFTVISKLKDTLNLDNGYRVVTNIGNDGRQSVKHLHFHILGGKNLTEFMA